MWGKGSINKALLAAQNKNLVVSTSLGVYLYRMNDFTLLRFIEGATDFWVSPDGELMATGHLDASIKLWRASDGSLKQTLHYDIGKIIYTRNLTLEMMESTYFEQSLPSIFVLLYKTLPVNRLVFSYDNQTLAAGYGDGHIGVWIIGQDTPKSVLSSAYLIDPATEMAYSSDNQYLAVYDYRALILWQSTNEKPLWAKTLSWAESLVFSPDSSILAFVKRDYGITRVILLESSNGEEIRQIDPEMDYAAPFSLNFSEDGQTLFITGTKLETNEIVRQARSVADNQLIEEIPADGEIFPGDDNALRAQGHAWLTGLAVPSNQEIQANVKSEQGSLLWQLPNDQFPPFKEPTALCAVGLLKVEYPDGTQYNIPVPNHPLCEGATLVPDHNQAFVWTYNRLSLVPFPDGEIVDLRGHEEQINAIAFGDNNRLMASGTIAPITDGKKVGTSEIMLWQLDPLKEIGHTEKLDNGDMRIMVFSPDTTLLASAGEMVRLWLVPGGQLRKYIKTYALSLAFSPDGKTLASGGRHGDIHLWSVPDGIELATLKGHTREVIGLAFTPDGTSLVSASFDGTVRIWGIK